MPFWFSYLEYGIKNDLQGNSLFCLLNMYRFLICVVILITVLCVSSCSEIGIDKTEDKNTSIDSLLYYYDNAGKLVILSRYEGDTDYDIIQEWDYDLQQSLDLIYTFSNIYLRKREGINKKKQSVVEIMSQSSDCILATRLNRYDDYSGRLEKDNTYSSGNHCMEYKGDLYKTGETKNVSIYADGRIITLNQEGRANTIEIIVNSVAYNPFVLYDSLEEDKSTPNYTPLFSETIVYKVHRGTIHCSVDRCFMAKANVETYGGFASMSVDLKYAYFPCGHTMDNAGEDGFGELVRNIGLTNEECNKVDYPYFNHFIKRNPEKSIYECVYLHPTGIGDHSEIPDNYSMYWVYNGVGQTWKKVYHRITYQKQFMPGDHQCIACDYSWFTPIVDSSDYIVFYMDSVLFVDIKKPYQGVIVNMEMGEMELVQQTPHVLSYEESDGVLYVNTDGPGSLLLKKR